MILCVFGRDVIELVVDDEQTKWLICLPLFFDANKGVIYTYQLMIIVHNAVINVYETFVDALMVKFNCQGGQIWI